MVLRLPSKKGSEEAYFSLRFSGREEKGEKGGCQIQRVSLNVVRFSTRQGASERTTTTDHHILQNKIAYYEGERREVLRNRTMAPPALICPGPKGVTLLMGRVVKARSGMRNVKCVIRKRERGRGREGEGGKGGRKAVLPRLRSRTHQACADDPPVSCHPNDTNTAAEAILPTPEPSAVGVIRHSD